MSLQDFKTGNNGRDRILVFTADVVPTEEEIALAKKHGTKAFRNSQCDAFPVEDHLCAVSVDGVVIPEGYKALQPAVAEKVRGGRKNPNSDVVPVSGFQPMTPSDVE